VENAEAVSRVAAEQRRDFVARSLTPKTKYSFRAERLIDETWHPHQCEPRGIGGHQGIDGSAKVRPHRRGEARRYEKRNIFFDDLSGWVLHDDELVTWASQVSFYPMIMSITAWLSQTVTLLCDQLGNEIVDSQYRRASIPASRAYSAIATQQRRLTAYSKWTAWTSATKKSPGRGSRINFP
jgi:hypothetical protein